MKFHPYAEVFPLIEGAELDALAEDIKAYGLREKIWLYEGKVLDGRNRFLACQKARVKPAYRTFKGSNAGALALVVSANMQRRHLSEGQKSMAAARIATAKAGNNQHSDDAVSIEEASKMVGTSKGSTKRAKRVLEKGSKSLVQAVDAGEVSVSKAASVVDLPKPKQLAAATKRPESEVGSIELTSEQWQPEENEDERLDAIEKEYAASIDKVMAADDKLSAAHMEIKRQAAEIATLKISRDGYQNRCGEQARIIKSLRIKLAKLEKAAA